MSAGGLDARSSFSFVLAAIFLPIVSAYGLWPALRLLRAHDAQRWAFVTAATSLVASMWIVLIDRNVVWTALPPLVATGAAVSLRAWRADFSRRDAVLLPVTASVFLALFDLLPALVFYQHALLSALLVLSVRLALPAIRRSRNPLPAPHCFAIAPLGLAVQSHFNGYEQRHNAWPVLAIALATPFVLRFVLRGTPRARRIVRVSLSWFVYPAAALMYTSAVSLLAAEGKPRADLFETAHYLTTGHEVARGELPYRDIVPAHGLIQDGLLDAAIIRSGDVSAGRVLEIRGVISGFTAVATYAFAAALTGSPDIGILAFFLGVILGVPSSVRAVPALLTLALIVAAVRRRDARRLGLAGAGAVIAALTSLDFGAYTLLAVVAAAVRIRTKSAAAAAAIGFAAASVVVAIALAGFGILDDALRVTFAEIPALGAVYALPFAITSPSLQSRRFFPDVLASIFDAGGFLPLVWIAGVIALAVMTAGRRDGLSIRHRGVRDALYVSLIWLAASGVSYAERHHYYYEFIVPGLLAATAYLLVRSRQTMARAAACSLIAAAIFAAQPTHDLIVVSMLRRARGPMSEGLVEIGGVERARGALYRERDARTVATAHDYMRRTLASDQTFFDFTNRGGLYFLLDRDVPIRHVEVAFYETEEGQREVIARIEGNPKVRLALVPAPGDASVTVDGVPNETRAPLVWDYLRSNFTPAFEHDGLVVWQRSGSTAR